MLVVRLPKTTILALSLIMTATVGLAADYEIVSGLATVETSANHYAAERFDHTNKRLHHCIAVLDAKTEQLTGECTERPGFPQGPAAQGPTIQGGISNRFGGLPVFGSWKIDQATGKTEFCVSHTGRCVEVTPQP